MVVGLTLYLLKQGYRPGDITVLTPYLKQLANIRVGRHPTLAASRRKTHIDQHKR